MPASRSGNPAKRAAAKSHQPTLEVTSASAWGHGDLGFVIRLPSGNVARVKRTLDLPTLLLAGRIPNPLGEILAQVIDQKSNAPLEQLAKDNTDPRSAEASLQFIELIDQQMVKVFVEPRVEIPPPANDPRSQGWVPTEGAIGIEALSLQDKMFVFAFAQGGTADLAKFRSESPAALASVLYGAEVQDGALDTVADGG